MQSDLPPHGARRDQGPGQTHQGTPPTPEPRAGLSDKVLLDKM